MAKSTGSLEALLAHGQIPGAFLLVPEAWALVLGLLVESLVSPAVTVTLAARPVPLALVPFTV